MWTARGTGRAARTSKCTRRARGSSGCAWGRTCSVPSVASALSLCDADFLISIFGAAEDSVPQLMLRAWRFCAGVPACMCAAGIAQAADTHGEIRFRSARRECTFDVAAERAYRITSVRSRGFSRRVRADF